MVKKENLVNLIFIHIASSSPQLYKIKVIIIIIAMNNGITRIGLESRLFGLDKQEAFIRGRASIYFSKKCF